MDPALQELADSGNPTDEVSVVVRLRDAAPPPTGLRIVARFGTIATARIQRLDVRRAWEDPAVISLKAPRWYATEYGPVLAAEDAEDVELRDTDRRRPPNLPETGRGTIIGVIDWGCDFAHPDFVTADGKSRLLALWDQRAPASDGNRYGYGRIHRGEELTAALAKADPYAAIGYHPGVFDTGIGAHGTHVMSIAAGNGRGGGPAGVAPEASLIFVHLGAAGWEKAGPLGDSANLLEAIDFIVRLADKRPVVLNLSMGRHGGPHDGTQLIERALDWLMRTRHGTAVVQSCGNYFARPVHDCGRLRSGEDVELTFVVNPGDSTPNELEVWYSGHDVFGARLIAPDGKTIVDVPLGGKEAVTVRGQRTGTLYHRARDPNNGDNHIDLFQYPSAPPGTWKLILRGIDVTDGRFHAWLERDPGCKTCQALFPQDQAVKSTTIGSICNGLLTTAVGAYDGHDPARALAPFSSAGPTRDGRIKPVVLAPGVKILAARSRPRSGSAPKLTRMSGTSMASPHVAGTIALMFECAGRLDIVRLRRLLFDSLAPSTAKNPADRDRIGYGFLDIAAAVKLARTLPAAAANPPPGWRAAREVTEAEPLALAAAAGVPEDEALTPEIEAPPITEAAAADGAPLLEISNSILTPEAELYGADAIDSLAVSESGQESAMCCGEKCRDCEHCRNYPCETCACCQPQPALESVDEFAGQIDPSWRTAAEPREQGHTAHMHPVDAADAMLRAGEFDTDRFLAQTLSSSGYLLPAGLSARKLFDGLAGAPPSQQLGDIQRYFAAVAQPGRKLTEPLRAGDLVIRRGDGGFAHAAMIAHPLLYREKEAAAHGLVLEGPWPGFYAHIVEPGMFPREGSARFARRLASPSGEVLPDTIVVRPVEADSTEDGSGEAAPDPNMRWLQAALNAAINAGLSVDGLDGPLTRAAIRRFQAERGLAVDGIAGSQTRGALAAVYPPPGGGYGYTPPGGNYQPPPTPPSYTPPGGDYPPPPTYTPPGGEYPPPPNYTPPGGDLPPPPTYTPPGGDRPPPPTYTPPGGDTPPPGYTPPGGDRPPPPTYTPPPRYTPPGGDRPPRYVPPKPPPRTYTPPRQDPPPPPAYTPPGGHYPPPPGYKPPGRTPPPYRPPRYVPPGGNYPPPVRPPGYRPPATPRCGGYAPPETVPPGAICRTLDNFSYDNAALTAAHRAAIDDLARRLIASRASAVSIIGHTSPEGPAAYNLTLGQRRAESAASALRAALERNRAGASSRIRFSVSSQGEAHTISTEAARNRRVEICYTEGPPIVPPQTRLRIRHSIDTPEGRQMLQKYEQAVRLMMAEPAGSPRSWLFQWYTHAVRDDRSKAAELNRIYGTSASANRALANAMWNTCQSHHPGTNELFFLPWHRMYVDFFERICRRVLNDDNFTLPYWNYSPEGARVLPAAFRAQGSPLFRQDRNPGINNGTPIDQNSPSAAFSVAPVLRITHYEQRGVADGFNLTLDEGVHGTVHTSIGNRLRGMGSVPWAANDPIFWLHHCNIDRVWASWNRGGRSNPTDARWLSQTFTFADENGQQVTAAVRDFTTTSARGYTYDRFEPVPGGRPVSEAIMTTEAEPDRQPVLVASAGSGGIALGAAPIRVHLATTREDMSFADEIEALGDEKKLYLVINNYRAEAQPGVLYHVYLDLPSGPSDQHREGHYVGTLSFFNAVPHSGHQAAAMTGRRRSFDVTDVVRRLRSEGRAGTAPSVTIVPAGRPASEARPVIGDISLVGE